MRGHCPHWATVRTLHADSDGVAPAERGGRQANVLRKIGVQQNTSAAVGGERSRALILRSPHGAAA